MGTFHEQKQLVENLNLKSGETWRGQCFFCNGNNTLSVSNIHNTLLWYCFRANCDTNGCSKGTLSKYDIAQTISARENIDNPTTLAIPEYWQHIADTGSETDMMKWLHAHQIWQMATRKLLEIRFDPKQGRVVLLKTHAGMATNAIGYSLNKDIKPKWYKYIAGRSPFIVDPGSNICIVVEDVPSACVVAAAGLAGVALMGTTYMDPYTAYITRYKYAIIALDKDATQKAITIQQTLSFFMPTRMKRLKTDLKYHMHQDLAKLLNHKTMFANGNFITEV